MVVARGHPNVKALHPTTLEVTKEEHLTPRGDCIVGVAADKAAADLNPRLKCLLRDPNTVVLVLLRAKKYVDVLLARGDSRLTLTSNVSIVVRKSRYVDGRTVAIRSSKAACDLSRSLTRALTKPIRLEVLIAAASPPHTVTVLRLARRPYRAWVILMGLLERFKPPYHALP